jgi:hypothetical protein
MAFQRELDSMQTNAVSVECAEPVARCALNPQDVPFLRNSTDINIKMSALLDHLKDLPIARRVVALDCEWQYGSKLQYPPKGRDKIALIQLAYETDPGNINVLLIQCRHLPTLPDALVRLFREPSIVYVGSRVKGDIDKLGEDFGIAEISSSMTYRDLAKMAKDRGKVPDAKVGLQTLVMVAALDAIKSLEVYNKLQSFPDLTERLASIEAKAGVLTDIVAPHGKVGSDGMGNVGALGLILEGETWDPPRNIKRMKQQKKPKRVMKISKVFAPNLKIVGFQVQENGVTLQACLKDFATSKPFKVELPLTMLKRHDPDTMKLKEASNEPVLDVGVGSLDGQWLRRDDDNEEEAGPLPTSVAISGRVTNSRIHHHLSLMHSALFWVIASMLCNDP